MPSSRESRRAVSLASRYSGESRPPSAAACSKISWPKYGISRLAFARLKAITSSSDPMPLGTPDS